MRSSTLRPWRSLGKTVSTETILTWVQLSSSSLCSPKSSQHSSKTWWAHVFVYCGLDGAGREGAQVSWDIERIPTGPVFVLISVEPRCCLTRILSSNVVHLGPQALRIQELALNFSTDMAKRHLQHQTSAGSNSTPSFPGIFFFFLWKPRLFWKNLTPSCEVSRCPPPDSVSAHTQQELESLLALSQHQIVKTHELLPSSGLKMSSLKASAGVSG